MVFKETKIKNIKEVTEPLKEEILKGDVHTIEEMRAWLQAFRYSDAIKDATINAILREFVMDKVSCDEMRNMDMIIELLRPQLEVTKEDIESFRQARWPESNSFGLWHDEKRSNEIQPVIIMGLYHHRDFIGLPSSFIKANNDILP